MTKLKHLLIWIHLPCCLLSASAQCESSFVSHINPKDVIEVVNNPFRPLGMGIIDLPLAKHTIVEFLETKKEVYPYSIETKQQSLIDIAPVSYPPDMSGRIAYHLDHGESPNGYVSSQGMFLTKNKEIYFWNWLNNRVICMQNEDGRGILLVSATYVDVEFKNVIDPTRSGVISSSIQNPPQASDVKKIFNLPSPIMQIDFGLRDVRGKLQRSEVMHFLKYGKYLDIDAPLSKERKYQGMWPITLSKHTRDKLRKSGIDFDKEPLLEVCPVGGILTKRGDLFFWKKLNDHVLEIRTEQQEAGYYLLSSRP